MKDDQLDQFMILMILIFSCKGFQTFKFFKRDLAIVGSPSGDYEPVKTYCPNGPNLRFSETGDSCLSQSEINYVKEKSLRSIPLWKDYLNQVNLIDFDLNQFLSKAEHQGGIGMKTLPSFGFAISGGGIRALCLGASILEGFDGRNQKAVDAKVGGLVQLATYASGLSGGAWLLGSWATSNFQRLPILNQTLWRLTEENDLWDWNIAKDYPNIYHVIKEKKQACFPISLVDAWGRIVARHFINDHDKGKGVLWSSIRDTSGYKNREFPFVIVLSLSRPSPHQSISIQCPIYEYTPEDFTVWNPRLNASIPIQYLGTAAPSFKDQDVCVEGYDNAGFIMGMSSNILSSVDGPPHKRNFFSKIFRMFIKDDSFEGKVPNPFRGLGAAPPARFFDSDAEMLLMADGGLASENIPLFPLIQPIRQLDVIIAIDSSAEERLETEGHMGGYPNGTSLYMTYLKTQLPEYSGYRFPKIPNSIDGTFLEKGYTKRPTFFGCYDPPPTPLIIYLPNYGAVAETDSESSKTTYTGELIGQFFDNGFAIATQSQGTTSDPEWPACLACALIDRQMLRNLTPRTDQCNNCFKRYCAVVP
ncbi:lysophospholipase catalytic domain-containing protein [Melampsora americana]|nr:lysophospholipase catalytic domain-containing protein [Melampsora americana]